MDNPLYFLLLGVLVAWVGSYFYSLQHNRRKLRILALWLQEALKLLGTKPSSRWQGTDRLDLNLTEGRGNVREAAIVLGMQSRQLFKALISTMRGGRDSLTLLMSLRTATVAGREFEIFEAKGPLPQSVVSAAGTILAWEIEDYSRAKNYRVAFRTPAARDTAYRVLALLLDDGFNIRRLSVRPSAPHILLVLNMGVIPQVEAAALLRTVKTLSDEVAEPFKVTPSRTTRPRQRRPAEPGNQNFPPTGKAPASGLDPGLTHNGYHTSNGHSQKDEG